MGVRRYSDYVKGPFGAWADLPRRRRLRMPNTLTTVPVVRVSRLINQTWQRFNQLPTPPQVSQIHFPHVLIPFSERVQLAVPEVVAIYREVPIVTVRLPLGSEPCKGPPIVTINPAH